MSFFANALSAALDSVWPRACEVPGCGRRSDRPGRHICSSCFAALPVASGSACSRCGRVFPGGGPVAFVCDECLARPTSSFDRACHAVVYAPPADMLLQAFKFRGARHLGPDFADLLEGAVRSRLPSGEIDAVVPVPLHPSRMRKRGYNQSAIVSELLASRLDRVSLPTALRRTRATGHQARKSRRERLESLKNAVEASNPRLLRGRTVLLVDDVATTFATLEECARALKAAGAARVWAATVACAGGES